MNALLRSNKAKVTRIDQPVESMTKMGLPGLDTFSINRLRETQNDDYWYAAIKKYLMSQELPAAKRLAQKVITNHQEFIVINDVLYHLWIPKGMSEPVQQICIPEDFKDMIFRAMHTSPNAGHQGVVKTYTKIRERYYWPKMSAETAEYVQQCEICAVANRGQQAKIPLSPLPVPIGPLHTIHIDILSIPTPSQGYKYILVIICAFSKYVIAKPLKRKTSRLVAKTFFNHYILTFGLPAQLVYRSDNGGEFTGRFNQTLQRMLGIKVIFITPYTPSSQGMVEKANRTILAILRRYAMNEANQWSTYLPYVVLAINSAHTETAKRSPFELIHGVPMKEPIDIQLPIHPKFVAKDEEAAFKYWNTHLTKIRNIAKYNLQGAKLTQKRNYDRYAKPSKYELNDSVFLRRPAIGLQEDTKLRPMYTGPYIIKRFVTPTNVELWNEKTKNILPRSYHINKIKKIKRKKNTNITEQRAVIHVDKQQELGNQELELRDNFNQLPYALDQDISDALIKMRRDRTVSLTHEEGGEEEEENNTSEEVEATQPLTVASNNKGIIDTSSMLTRAQAKIMKQTSNNQDEKRDIDVPINQEVQDPTHIIGNDKTTVENSKVNDISGDPPSTTDDIYHPINKIHRRRHAPDGKTEYYVSWRDRPKRDNVWIQEDMLTEPLKDRARKLQIPESKPKN